MRAALAALISGLLGAACTGVSPASAQTPYVAMAAPEPGGGVCPSGLCQAEALNSLFEALAATEAGTPDRPVHILQLGDSHTAGDRITGKTRAVLQARFGDGGRGVLPPGVPHEGYSPMQVEVTPTDWRITPAPLTYPGFEPFPVGLTNVWALDTEADSRLTLRLDARLEATEIRLCWEAPWGVILSDEDETWEVEPERRGWWLSCGGVRPVTASGELIARAVDPDRPLVKLDHIRLTKRGPGVVVSNLGMVGATLADLAARTEEVVIDELAEWRPDLIILAYGTNEGFDDALDPVAYEGLLRGQIERLRLRAPGAALMILGAPDGLRSGVEGGCSADGLRAPPPSLAVVRDVQGRVAADMGVAFWDWHGRMGGDCSADRLALMAEPHVRGDRVHFTGAGADWIGGMLAGDLLAAYDAWKAAPKSEAGSAD
ncbi:GDSL-type esterase/lipase family protein [Brevundimonas sp.]|uniref:GDSL-type esterase/lipase family protein n=1 Tax=Brevundimonas sp. TaxID=1871086 RepID=UPI0027E8C02F|nr:GDSL-type esterase/lipase family protein [Brevundimonas sp.]MDQ7813412.1 GDSL-type esterase/lipase family protein [Brevundimonas sp.]